MPRTPPPFQPDPERPDGPAPIDPAGAAPPRDPIGDAPHPRSSDIESGDIDLYCLTCGYNLRGLTGDPRRCPECGGLNPVGDVILPAAIITEQLRRMETAPAFCLAAFLAAALFGAIFAMLLRGPIRMGEIFPCTAGLMSIVAIVWGVSVDRFRVSCTSKPGWPAALLRYHLWGIGLMLVVFGPTALIVWCASLMAPAYQTIIALPAVVLCASALVCVTVWPRPTLMTRMYARAREDLEVLQREVAVALARDRTRKALQRQRR